MLLTKAEAAETTKDKLTLEICPGMRNYQVLLSLSGVHARPLADHGTSKASWNILELICE